MQTPTSQSAAIGRPLRGAARNAHDVRLMSRVKRNARTSRIPEPGCIVVKDGKGFFMNRQIKIQTAGDVQSGLRSSDPVWADDPNKKIIPGYDVMTVDVPVRDWELPHCYQKVAELAGEALTEGVLSPRQLMQVGYNLGRVAEITGEDRAIWDTTKWWVQPPDGGDPWGWVELKSWAEARLSDTVLLG